MNLIERIDALCERAGGQTSLEDKRAESRRLQPLLSEAQELSEELGSQVEHLRLLQDQGVRIPSPDSAEAARRTLDKLRERFAKQSRAEQLTRGQNWNRLNEQVEETCKSISSALSVEWRRIVETAFSGERPNNLEQTLAATAENMRNLERYRTVYSELERYARSRPAERADFDRLRDLARQLNEIHQGFDFDVPEDVNRFLRAVADGGADLDLLTAGVREWLQQQNTSERYRIVAKVDMN